VIQAFEYAAAAPVAAPAPQLARPMSGAASAPEYVAAVPLAPAPAVEYPPPPPVAEYPPPAPVIEYPSPPPGLAPPAGFQASPPYQGPAPEQAAAPGKRPKGPEIRKPGLWSRSAQKIADRGPKALLLSLTLVFILGALAGGLIMHTAGQREVQRLEQAAALQRQQQQDQKARKIADLRMERERLQEEILRLAGVGQSYPEGSIPRVLAGAATEEYNIADTLLLQQIASLESGAQPTVSPKETRPDPELAARLEEEMTALEARVEKVRAEAATMAEMPRLVAQTSIATELINLAILNRNRLIAKYGLSSPLPSQYGAESGGGAQLQEMRQENARLKTENETLKNSDSYLYAAAVSDLESGRLSSSEGKFNQLIKVFPKSPLTAKAKEGLTQVRLKSAEKEAAKNPPVAISSSAVRHDGGYLKNESYVRVSFKNVSPLMIKKVEFKILTFDDHGYPVPSKRKSVLQDNDLTAIMAENVPAGRGDYGMWELSEKVRQVKVKLQKVEFYEAEAWQDEDIEEWAAKESGRYQAEQVAAVAPKNPPRRRR
jgi:TolA-binding protein